MNPIEKFDKIHWFTEPLALAKSALSQRLSATAPDKKRKGGQKTQWRSFIATSHPKDSETAARSPRRSRRPDLRASRRLFLRDGPRKTRYLGPCSFRDGRG